MKSASPVAKWLCYLMLLTIVAEGETEARSARPFQSADTNSGTASDTAFPPISGDHSSQNMAFIAKRPLLQVQPSNEAQGDQVFGKTSFDVADVSYGPFAPLEHSYSLEKAPNLSICPV